MNRKITFISVVICTHNPRRDYILRTLEALKAQTLPKDEWELLIVDNASKIAVSNLVELSWHPNVAIVSENELGLTHARLRGIKESRGDYLIRLAEGGAYSHALLKTLVLDAPPMKQNPVMAGVRFWRRRQQLAGFDRSIFLAGHRGMKRAVSELRSASQIP